MVKCVSPSSFNLLSHHKIKQQFSKKLNAVSGFPSLIFSFKNTWPQWLNLISHIDEGKQTLDNLSKLSSLLDNQQYFPFQSLRIACLLMTRPEMSNAKPINVIFLQKNELSLDCGKSSDSALFSHSKYICCNRDLDG